MDLSTPTASTAETEAITHEFRSRPYGHVRLLLRGFIHFFSYHLFLASKRTRMVKAAGFRLQVRPTVFHPRIFLTSDFFAGYISSLNLLGKRVVDVGTGTGILALSAARAGASGVVALDINPAAVDASLENATINGLGDRVTAMVSDLLSVLPSEAVFDVISAAHHHFLANPVTWPIGLGSPGRTTAALPIYSSRVENA